LPDGVIYLDGNSLGVLPRTAAARVQQVVTQEWGTDLITSWNKAGWMDLPQRVGDKIARLVGAGPGELVVADSTSVNLFKVLSAALTLVKADAPARRVILSERSNFPTDLYIAEALARERGFELQLAEADELPGLLGEHTAVLMLTHVNYRTGRMHDMAALTAAAHAAGALVIWDLAHSAGAVPVDLNQAQADFAVGCGYKYLNGGPGAPAFVWVHPRHVSRFWQPLAGWIGHAAPFEFTPGYRPAEGIARYLCGTPAVLSLAALECGVDTVLAAEPLGGMAALRRKSLALTRLFAQRVQATCPQLALASPTDDTQRGSQVCFAHPHIAYPVVQALIARGVIGDFRAPDVLRFGFTPLYLRFVDAWDAAEHLRQVLTSEEWRQPQFNQKHAVT
jgi:kynureninase